MSDLTATNCGCGSVNDNRGGCGCNNILWIIILLALCGGNDDCGCGGGFFGGFGNGNGGCECIIWILLLSCVCGNGNGFC